MVVVLIAVAYLAALALTLGLCVVAGQADRAIERQRREREGR